MPEPVKPATSAPPHNPELRDLIEAKRRGFPSALAELKAGFQGWHERGYLPHRDKPGLIQFVTFHLADSFPRSLRSEWEHVYQIEDRREQRAQLEAYLDKGLGECFLRQPEVAKLVEQNFRNFSGERYSLLAWVIMPNHVHVLFKVGNTPMGKIVGSWKKHTARAVNDLLGKHGSLWAQDYFDVFTRDSDQLRKTIRYIEHNPTKAKLVLDPKDWPWSSARFRDGFGELAL